MLSPASYVCGVVGGAPSDGTTASCYGVLPQGHELKHVLSETRGFKTQAHHISHSYTTTPNNMYYCGQKFECPVVRGRLLL